MTFGGPTFGWGVRIGRDLWCDALLSISIGIGFRNDAPLGEIPWRYYWRWSSASLPSLILRQFYWYGRMITLPVGFCAFGRCRAFWTPRA